VRAAVKGLRYDQRTAALKGCATTTANVERVERRRTKNAERRPTDVERHRSPPNDERPTSNDIEAPRTTSEDVICRAA